MDRGGRSGFTIVELLIVVVVIAILAAITIVAFTGIQSRADDSAVKSNLAQLSRQIELYKINSSTNQYPNRTEMMAGVVPISVTKNSYNQDRNNFYYCQSADGSQYSFGIITKQNQAYFLTNGSVVNSTPAVTYQSDTCQNVGEPGVSGITGYTVNNRTWASWVN